MTLQQSSNFVFIRLPNEAQNRILEPPSSVASIGTLIPWLHNRFKLPYPLNYYNVYYREGLVDLECRLSGFSLDRVLTLKCNPMCQPKSLDSKDQPSQSLSPPFTTPNSAAQVFSFLAEKTSPAAEIKPNDNFPSPQPTLSQPQLEAEQPLNPVPLSLDQPSTTSQGQPQLDGTKPSPDFDIRSTKGEDDFSPIISKLSACARRKRNRRNRLREKRRRREAKLDIEHEKASEEHIPRVPSSIISSQVRKNPVVNSGGDGSSCLDRTIRANPDIEAPANSIQGSTCKKDKNNPQLQSILGDCRQSQDRLYSQALLVSLRDVENALKQPTDIISFNRLSVTRFLYVLRSLTVGPSLLPYLTRTAEAEKISQSPNDDTSLSRINMFHTSQIPSDISYDLKDRPGDYRIESSQCGSHQNPEARKSPLVNRKKKRKMCQADNASSKKPGKRDLPKFLGVVASISSEGEGHNNFEMGKCPEIHSFQQNEYKRTGSSSCNIVPAEPVPIKKQKSMSSLNASKSIQALPMNSQNSMLECVRNAVLLELSLGTEPDPSSASYEKVSSDPQANEDFPILQSAPHMGARNKKLEMDSTKGRILVPEYKQKENGMSVLVNSEDAGGEKVMIEKFASIQPKIEPVDTVECLIKRNESPSFVHLSTKTARSSALIKSKEPFNRSKGSRQGSVSDVLAMARKKGMLSGKYTRNSAHPPNYNSTSFSETRFEKNTSSSQGAHKNCTLLENKTFNKTQLKGSQRSLRGSDQLNDQYEIQDVDDCPLNDGYCNDTGDEMIEGSLSNDHHDNGIHGGIDPRIDEHFATEISDDFQPSADDGNFERAEGFTKNVELICKGSNDENHIWTENNDVKQNLMEHHDKQNDPELIEVKHTSELHESGGHDRNDGDRVHDCVEQMNAKQNHTKLDNAQKIHVVNTNCEQRFTREPNQEGELSLDRSECARKRTLLSNFSTTEISRKQAETESQSNFSIVLRDARHQH